MGSQTQTLSNDTDIYASCVKLYCWTGGKNALCMTDNFVLARLVGSRS